MAQLSPSWILYFLYFSYIQNRLPLRTSGGVKQSKKLARGVKGGFTWVTIWQCDWHKRCSLFWKCWLPQTEEILCPYFCSQSYSWSICHFLEFNVKIQNIAEYPTQEDVLGVKTGLYNAKILPTYLVYFLVKFVSRCQMHHNISLAWNIWYLLETKIRNYFGCFLLL